MNIPEFNEIIEPNDQTEARREHLEKLREIVGNVYPNKFERSRISGEEDTITNLVNFAPVAEIKEEIEEHIKTLAERERPDQQLKEKLNEKLKSLGSVRVSGRLAVPPRVMGKAAFVHLSDGVSRLQIYCRKGEFLLEREKGRWGDGEKGRKGDGEKGRKGERENEISKTISPSPHLPISLSPFLPVSPSPEKAWEVFGLLDHGDFIGVEGYLFLTNTGELSVHVEKLQFLAKAMLPMPDKMHGIADPELQRRYRYADLIASSLQIEHEEGELTTREVFERRAKLISGMRRFLDEHGYIEVETPMLTAKATGAAATPFETYHNALDIPLYARIAPELYLKRLTVGGFEKVYELNRNFRNEGLSHKHNPEFTMLEFYCAYMDVNGMMDFCEEMLKESVKKATGGNLQVEYIIHPTVYVGKPELKKITIDFSKFERLSMKEAIGRNTSNKVKDFIGNDIETWLNKDKNPKLLLNFLWWMDNEYYGTFFGTNTLNGDYEQMVSDEEIETGVKNKWIEFSEKLSHKKSSETENAKDIVTIFEDFVESKLIQPTFITDYPKSISPLSKASPENPNIAERFELFINGMECANGFSELNDPQEQYERFADQMKERASGDKEAMVLDEDYIRALAYGMPPAAGIGIGIDRLVMLLTNKHSIRDVILFPHMRPVSKEEAE